MDNQPQQQNTFEPFQAQTNYQQDQQKRQIRLAILIVLVALILYAVYAIISSMLAKQSTGILQIETSAAAQVTADQAGSQTTKLGVGSVKVRLKPGQYQVTATTGNTAVSAIVQVAKQKTTTQALTITPQVPSQTIAKFTAQDIYPANDNNLYFVNIPQTILYSFPIGAAAGRPYTTTVNPITQAYWLSPTSFFGQISGAWSYFNNEVGQPISYQGASPSINSISFNHSGAVAFTTSNKNIVLINQPGGTPQSIGSTKTTNAQTSIAPNGNVLVYTPSTTYGGTSEATSVYQAGAFTNLPSSLTGIANVEWSTDSSKFSYTTSKGIYVYDLNKQTNTQIFTGNPTDPLSVTWLSPDTLIYPDSNVVWGYQTNNNISIELTTFDGILNTTQSFGIAADGQTVYFGTVPDSNGKGGNIYQFFPNYNNLSKDQQQALLAVKQSSLPQTPPTYYGTDDLLNIGLSSDQLNSVEYAFGQYFRSAKKTVKRIDISSVQAVSRNPNDPSPLNTVNFNVTFNTNDSYQARVDYSSITTIHLYLYNPTNNALVYDSGDVSSQ